MASVQAVDNLQKVTTDLEDDFSPAYSTFQAKYNSIKEKEQAASSSRFIKEVIPETISMLNHENIFTRDNSISLERFLQTFYIVNDADVANFGIDKTTLQRCFNRISISEFIQPNKYIQLINVRPDENLKGFIDLYQYIFSRDGGKRRKSISRTRGPSKHKRRRLSTKRRTTRRRRY